MINILALAVIFTLVTDVLHFWQNFSPYITKWLTKGRFSQAIDFKLFTCSTCQTWWSSVIYLLCTGALTIPNLCLALVAACCTPLISHAWFTVTDAITRLISKIDKV